MVSAVISPKTERAVERQRFAAGWEDEHMKRSRLADGTLDDNDLLQLARSKATPVELVQEPTLEEVADEDRSIVTSVLLAMQAVQYPTKVFKSWTVGIEPTGYLITGMLPPDFEVSLSDLEMLHFVNPVRIANVRVVRSNGSNQVHPHRGPCTARGLAVG